MVLGESQLLVVQGRAAPKQNKVTHQLGSNVQRDLKDFEKNSVAERCHDLAVLGEALFYRCLIHLGDQGFEEFDPNNALLYLCTPTLHGKATRRQKKAT
jgi:hypothetical protein